MPTTFPLRGRSGPRLAFACALLAALVMTIGGVLAPAASAATYTLRHNVDTNGDITYAANTIETCPAAATGCTAALGAPTGQSVSDTTLDNNNYTMGYVNVDPGGGRFDSSRSDVTLPTGATVLWAGLYWGGDTSAGTNGAAAPDASSQGTVTLKSPGAGSYTTVTANAGDIYNLSFSGHAAYEAFADVTSQVAAAGAGTYTAANVQAGTGQDRYGGWSLVVAYRDPAGHGRSLTVFDGLAAVGSGNNQTISVSGFHTPGSGAVNSTLGLIDWESDLGINGDSATLVSGGVSTPLQDALTQPDNVANSAIEVGGVATHTKSPDYSNNLGFDAKLFQPPANAIPNGATTAQINFTSSGDVYFPGVVTLATDLYAPHLQPAKTATDVTNPGLGGSPTNARVGDTIRYAISATNTGEDGATGVTVTDPLPAGITYVPGSLHVTQDTANGSNVGAKTDGAADDTAEYDPLTNEVTFRLGAGASATAGGAIAPAASFTATFDVTVNSNLAVGTGIDNSGAVTYGAASNGAFSQTNSSSPPTAFDVVPGPDLTVAATHAGALVQGATTSYTLAVSNVGTGSTDASPAVSLSTTFPSGETAGAPSSAPGWSCAVAGQTLTCTRSDALAAGSAYPGVVVPVGVARDAGSPLAVTATVGGGGDNSSANDTATDSGSATASADVAVTQSASDATPDPGADETFTVSVRDAGPSDAAGVTLDDTLPAGLTLVSATPSQGSCDATAHCTLGTVPAGTTATVAVVAHAARSAQGQTLTNHAAGATSTADPDHTNDAADATVTVNATDLALSASHSGQLVRGATASYVLSVANAGTAPSDTSSFVMVSDTLPSGVTPGVPSGTGWTCSAGGQAISCNRDDALAPGAAYPDIVVPISVAQGAPGSVGDAASVTGGGDTRTANDSAAFTAPVGSVADLSLTQAAAPTTVPVDGEVTFTLTTTNRGPSDATATRLVDTLSPGLAIVSAVPSQGACDTSATPMSCDLGTVGAGASATIAVTAHVGAGAAGTTIGNRASVSAAPVDPRPADNEADARVAVPRPAPPTPAATPGPGAPAPHPVVAPQPVDLRASIVALTRRPQAGSPLTYLLTVGNAGPGRARVVRVTQTLPRGARVLTIAPSQGRCSVIAGTVSCALGDVPADRAVRIRVILVPGTSGDISSDTSVTSASRDTRPTNNHAQSRLRVAPPVRMQLRLRSSTAHAHPGELFDLGLTFTNAGPGAALGVLLCDDLPDGLIFLRSWDAVLLGGQVCWPRTDVPAHTTRRHWLLVQASPGASPGLAVDGASARARNAPAIRRSAGIVIRGPRIARGDGVTG